MIFKNQTDLDHSLNFKNGIFAACMVIHRANYFQIQVYENPSFGMQLPLWKAVESIGSSPGQQKPFQDEGNSYVAISDDFLLPQFA